MKTKFLKIPLWLQLIISIFFVLTIIFGLIAPVTSDAGKYAAISRIIYETGEWINLKIHYEPYLQKPPLLFWITTPFYYLLGPSEFAFKLPVLLYSAIAIWSTYKFTALYYGKETAKLAAIMLATSEFYFLFHNDIHMDSLLAANVMFAMWQFAEYFKTGKWINILLAATGTGLAMISKGPIGLFVPGTAILFHLALHRNVKILLNIKAATAAILFIVILVAGLAGTYNQFGWEGIRFFIWDNNAGRITGELKGNSTDLLFYFHTTLYIFLPWGFLFFVALLLEVRDKIMKRKSTKKDEHLTLGALIFYWLVISVSKAKAPHYLMVLAPFMALLTAKWMYRIYSNGKAKRRIKAITSMQTIVIGATWLITLLLCTLLFPVTNLLFWTGTTILFVLSFFKFKASQITVITFRSVIAVIAFNYALNANVFPRLFDNHSVIAACKVFNEKTNGDEKLNIYQSEHRELFFYAKNPGHFLYDKADLDSCIRNSTDWIYTNEEGLKEIQDSGASYQLMASFKHRSISKLSFKYINPKTRAGSLKDMHLIRLDSRLP